PPLGAHRTWSWDSGLTALAASWRDFGRDILQRLSVRRNRLVASLPGPSETRASSLLEEIHMLVHTSEALDRLGDEIAELSGHIEVAVARLLDLIGEFDARGGWANGFKSCAEWLSWRVAWIFPLPTSAFAWRVPCRSSSSSERRSPAARSPSPRSGP